MKPADAIPKVVALLNGEDWLLDGTIVRMPNGGPLDLEIVVKDGRDVRINFVGKKPVADYYGVNFVLNGLTLCIKGIRVDAALAPGRFDPFYPWEALGL